jgi:uridine kinase
MSGSILSNYEFDTHNNMCFSPVIARRWLVGGDFANRVAAETTGACCYRLPGPVRILNVLTGLFFVGHSCDARAMIDFDAAVSLIAKQPGTRLVAIDGLPVSGKSSLAGRLEAELGATIVYLDDFVRPPADWRGKADPAFPFPYMRYDEFTHTVRALAERREARYRGYDWTAGRLADDWTEVDPNGLVVVEGVSTLNPDLAPLYDMRLWVESDASTTLEASLARGVGDWENEWRTLFMPSVALYLASDPWLRADHIVIGRGAMS